MTDAHYMQRCISLALLGKQTAAPNPLVGAVVVLKGQIIGEGWHYQAGLPHAEVNAINSVKDKSKLKESTIYVNLEPCAHHGRTPPCAALLVKHQLKRVVIGCKDPFAKVNGAGIAMLKEAGISTDVGVLEAESKAVNKTFFTYHSKKRPFVLLKWAQTLDGYLDKDRTEVTKGSHWISNEQAKLEVHQLRAETDAILVGGNTVLNDDPQLDTRLVEGPSPLRLVLDRSEVSPEHSNLFQDGVPTVLFTSSKRILPASVEQVVIAENDDPLKAILNFCHKRQLQSLLVEGGATLLKVFLRANLWDETCIYIGSETFGSGIKAPKIEQVAFSKSAIGGNTKLVYQNL
jgi:diaminohydroxyphosphoribosylaminopyrimidine deaminase/5-amino-6-(5-phosphoribosylamino)uracil reductase